MEKKLALIGSFCDTPRKIEVLDQNISIIKSYGVDVMLISPFPLPENILKKCDYFFLTKDNIVLDWPVRAYSWWRSFIHEGKTYILANTCPDYGFAGLWQVKQLSEIALTLDYDQFFHMIYDTKIEEAVISGFKSNKRKSVFPSKRENAVWPIGLHYIILDKENLKNLSSEISLDSYVSLPEGADAFNVITNVAEKYNFDIEKDYIEDWIFYHEGADFINCSNIPNLKFFIERDPISMSNVKLVFYELSNNLKAILEVGDSQKEIELENLKIVDLGFPPDQVPTHIWMEINGERYNIRDLIYKVKNSVMTIE